MKNYEEYGDPIIDEYFLIVGIFIHVIPVLIMFFISLFGSWSTCKQAILFIIAFAGTALLTKAIDVDGAYPAIVLILVPVMTIAFFADFSVLTPYTASLVGIYFSIFDFYTDILVIMYWIYYGFIGWATTQICILIFAQILGVLHFKNVRSSKKESKQHSRTFVFFETLFTMLGLGRQVCLAIIYRILSIQYYILVICSGLLYYHGPQVNMKKNYKQ